MTVRHTRKRTRRSCTGKVPMTKDDAIRAADRWRLTKFARMVAYRCRWYKLENGSAAWHIGNQK